MLLETFSIWIGSGGFAVGVVAYETGGRVMQRHKMGAEYGLSPPAVEEDAHIALFGGFVKLPGIQEQLCPVTPFLNNLLQGGGFPASVFSCV